MSTAVIRNIRQALSLAPSATTYTVHGWITRIRRYRKHDFVEVNDGTSYRSLQCVVFKDGGLDIKPSYGSCVSMIGNIVQSSGNQQDIEFRVQEFKILGDCDPMTYPFAHKNDLTRRYCRSHPHLKPRLPLYTSLNRVKSELHASINMIMGQMDFFQVQTPILTSNDSESSGDLFVVSRDKYSSANVASQSNEQEIEVNDNDTSDVPSSSEYFGKKVYLTCSAQLHLEMLAASLSRVYTISSAFRAENSNTRRHMSEFTMFEAEEAFCYTIDDLMNRVETIIKFAMQYIANISPYKSDLSSILSQHNYEATFDLMLKQKFERITYTDAIRMINDNFSDRPGGGVIYGQDIGRTHEKYLVEYCANKPIFIINYPKHLKPFYMKVDDGGQTALCFDLIAPIGGELCGGSLREDRLDVLDENIVKMIKSVDHSSNNVLSRLKWYTDLRRYGSFPHGGFGIGIDRLVQSITGINNIKDVSMFPRWPRHCPL